MALRRISRTAEEQNALLKRFGIAQDTTDGKPEETEDFGSIQEKQQLQRELRDLIVRAATVIDSGIAPGRASSLALTKLEEALMWAGKGIFS